VALAQWAVSPDGKYLAYGLAQGGADWQTVHVREIASGRERDDRVEWFRARHTLIRCPSSRVACARKGLARLPPRGQSPAGSGAVSPAGSSDSNRNS
jgi:hypothetical protein